MVLELARFWASRAKPGADGRWHVRGVIGPDEYHEDVDDNAYTNQLAAWLLARPGQSWPPGWPTATPAAGGPCGRRSTWTTASWTTGGPPPGWSTARTRRRADRAAPRLPPARGGPGRAPLPHRLGRGGARLEPAGPAQGHQAGRRGAAPGPAGRALPPGGPGGQLPLLRAAHGHDSSLSPAIHALVAARLGDLGTAERYLRRATRLDLDLDQGVTAAGGVHIAALGGLWQALVLGFGGMTVDGEELRFAPHVPGSWGSLRFRVHWRGELLEVTPPARRRRLGVGLRPTINGLGTASGRRSVELRRLGAVG